MLPPIHKFIKKPQTITTHFHRGDGKCMTFCTEKMQPPPGLMDAAAELHTCVCVWATAATISNHQRASSRQELCRLPLDLNLVCMLVRCEKKKCS